MGWRTAIVALIEIIVMSGCIPVTELNAIRQRCYLSIHQRETEIYRSGLIKDILIFDPTMTINAPLGRIRRDQGDFMISKRLIGVNMSSVKSRVWNDICATTTSMTWGRLHVISGQRKWEQANCWGNFNYFRGCLPVVVAAVIDVISSDGVYRRIGVQNPYRNIGSKLPLCGFASNGHKICGFVGMPIGGGYGRVGGFYGPLTIVNCLSGGIPEQCSENPKTTSGDEKSACKPSYPPVWTRIPIALVLGLGANGVMIVGLLWLDGPGGGGASDCVFWPLPRSRVVVWLFTRPGDGGSVAATIIALAATITSTRNIDLLRRQTVTGPPTAPRPSPAPPTWPTGRWPRTFPGAAWP